MGEYIVEYVIMDYTTGVGEEANQGRTTLCTAIQSKINEMVTNRNEFVSQQIHGDQLFLFFKKKLAIGGGKKIEKPEKKETPKNQKIAERIERIKFYIKTFIFK
jgi:hypothetical protein